MAASGNNHVRNHRPSGSSSEVFRLNPNRSLFIRDLPFSYMANDIRKLCEHEGFTVVDAHVVTTSQRKTMQFGCVMFSTDEEAQQAKERLHNKRVHGRDLRVCDFNHQAELQSSKDGKVMVSFKSHQRLTSIITEQTIRDVFETRYNHPLAKVSIRRHAYKNNDIQVGYGFFSFGDDELDKEVVSTVKKLEINNISFDCEWSSQSNVSGTGGAIDASEINTDRSRTSPRATAMEEQHAMQSKSSDSCSPAICDISTAVESPLLSDPGTSPSSRSPRTFIPPRHSSSTSSNVSVSSANASLRQMTRRPGRSSIRARTSSVTEILREENNESDFGQEEEVFPSFSASTNLSAAETTNLDQNQYSSNNMNQHQYSHNNHAVASVPSQVNTPNMTWSSMSGTGNYYAIQPPAAHSSPVTVSTSSSTKNYSTASPPMYYAVTSPSLTYAPPYLSSPSYGYSQSPLMNYGGSIPPTLMHQQQSQQAQPAVTHQQPSMYAPMYGQLQQPQQHHHPQQTTAVQQIVSPQQHPQHTHYPSQRHGHYVVPSAGVATTQQQQLPHPSPPLVTRGIRTTSFEDHKQLSPRVSSSNNIPNTQTSYNNPGTPGTIIPAYYLSPSDTYLLDPTTMSPASMDAYTYRHTPPLNYNTIAAPSTGTAASLMPNYPHSHHNPTTSYTQSSIPLSTPRVPLPPMGTTSYHHMMSHQYPPHPQFNHSNNSNSNNYPYPTNTANINNNNVFKY